MAFDIPRSRVLSVDSVDILLDEGPHPFAVANSAAIAEDWEREVALNPALFDGKIVLLAELVYRSGMLVGRCHGTRFSAFLYWRSNRALSNAEHAFAHAALVSSDGALIAIRMGAHTANAGRVYFAAGSFEPTDFVDGKADLAGNMAREVREETGLNITGTPHEARYHLYSEESGTVIFRRYYLDQTADEIADRIAAFVADDPEPEIEGPVIIRSADPLPEGIMPHMAAIVRWHFSDEGQQLEA